VIIESSITIPSGEFFYEMCADILQGQEVVWLDQEQMSQAAEAII